MVTTNNKQNCPNSTFVTQKGIQFILDLPKVAVITTLIPLHSPLLFYEKPLIILLLNGRERIKLNGGGGYSLNYGHPHHIFICQKPRK